jgi:homoserine O-acetyltransferase
MDSHDIGRGRGGVEMALKSIQAKVFAVGVNSDLLFLAEEARFLSQAVPAGHYGEIVSTAGHDAFLIEFAQLSKLIESFYHK